MFLRNTTEIKYLFGEYFIINMTKKLNGEERNEVIQFFFSRIICFGSPSIIKPRLLRS